MSRSGLIFGIRLPAFARQAAGGFFRLGARARGVCQQPQVFDLLTQPAGYRRDQQFIILGQGPSGVGFKVQPADLFVQHVDRFLKINILGRYIRNSLHGTLVIHVTDAFILMNGVQEGFPAFMHEALRGGLGLCPGAFSRFQQPQVLDLE